MNAAALFVFRILGGITVIFALDAVIAPKFGREASKAVTENLDVLIVAFVGILAKTGRDAQEPKGTESDPVSMKEVEK